MKNLILTFVFFISTYSFAGIIPYDYESYVKLPLPLDLKRYVPNNLLFDNQEKFMAVCFGYRPSTVYIYDTEEFDVKHVFKIKGHVYFSSSYFGTTSNGNLYIDYGRWNPKYYACNLKTGEKVKKKCEKTPMGCNYFVDYQIGVKVEDGVIYYFGDEYVIKTTSRNFEIFRPKKED